MCLLHLKLQLPTVLPFLRHRMERWQLDIPLAHAADRAHASLQRAFALLPPRVAVVLLYTLLNGWTTCRRFQEEGICKIGGKKGTQDSIEHLAFCSYGQAVATNIFHLPHHSTLTHTQHFTAFLGLHKEGDALFTKRVLYLRVLYMLFNHAKQAGNFSSPAEAQDLARTLLWHAAKGHAATEKMARALLHLPTARQARKGLGGSKRTRSTA